MSRAKNLAIASDEAELMPRNVVDTETEELYRRQPCGSHKITRRHRAHHNLARGDSCCLCGQFQYDLELQENPRRKKKTRIQLQHCPSCHCPPEMAIYSPSKMKYSDNVEAVLNQHERYGPSEHANRGIKKSHSSPLSPRLCQCERCVISNLRPAKKSSSRSHRHQGKSEREHAWSSTLRDIISVEGGENSDSDHNSRLDASEKYHKSHQRSKKAQRERRKDDDKQDEDWQQRFQRDYQELVEYKIRDREKLKSIDEQTRKVGDEEAPTEGQQSTYIAEDITRKINLLPNKLSRLTSNGLPNGLQAPTIRNQHEEEQSKSTSRVEASTSYHCALDDRGTSDNIEAGYPRSERRRNEMQDSPSCKPRRRGASFRDPISNAEEIVPEDRREAIEEEVATCRTVTKEGASEIGSVRRNLHAGGDLDLQASKTHILSVIDQAFSKDPRAMQADYSREQVSLSQRGTSADYVKHLKIFHLNHIQDEIRKLYNLEVFHDTCSPRRSLPTLQGESTVSDRRVEQPEQQKEQDYSATAP
ncbi:hypothetical protein KM043_006736 [Ampulex compressa]|nr:hypothetical protein KM043_006736 [Ampulex compressa]